MEWGLDGLCPGPVVASLFLNPNSIVPFLLIMLMGSPLTLDESLVLRIALYPIVNVLFVYSCWDGVNVLFVIEDVDTLVAKGHDDVDLIDNKEVHVRDNTDNHQDVVSTLLSADTTICHKAVRNNMTVCHKAVTYDTTVCYQVVTNDMTNSNQAFLLQLISEMLT